MPIFPYDVVDDARVKRLGHRLLGVTKHLTGRHGMDAHEDAVAIMRQAVGFEPSGSGPNRVTDEQIQAAIPRTEGMLRLANAYAWSSRRPRRKA